MEKIGLTASSRALSGITLEKMHSAMITQFEISANQMAILGIKF